MKRIGALGIIILIVMVILVASVSVTAFASASNQYVLHDGVNLYADNTLSAVAKELNQNDSVEILESLTIAGTQYYKVKVGDVVGYVNANYIYSTSDESCYQLYSAKAYGKKIGESVSVYSTPSDKSSIIRQYMDGTVLTVTESEVEGYHIVVMDEGVGYVKDENLTTSISYNERIAIAIALICVVAVILILVITHYRRNSDYYKSKRTSK